MSEKDRTENGENIPAKDVSPLRKFASSGTKIAAVFILAYLVIRYVFIPGSLPTARLSYSEKETPRAPASRIGHLAPPLDVTTLQGQYLSLASLKGKVVLLNFFGTWCPPCRFEMPSMNKLYHTYAEKGLEIIAIAVDGSEDTVKEFLKEVKVDFPVGFAREEQLVQYYISGLPTSFIIDKRGVIREIIPGAINWEAREINTRVQELLAETP